MRPLRGCTPHGRLASSAELPCRSTLLAHLAIVFERAYQDRRSGQMAAIDGPTLRINGRTRRCLVSAFSGCCGQNNKTYPILRGGPLSTGLSATTLPPVRCLRCANCLRMGSLVVRSKRDKANRRVALVFARRLS